MAISSFSYIFYLLDSSLSSGQRYSPFEQLEPGDECQHVTAVSMVTYGNRASELTSSLATTAPHLSGQSNGYLLHSF